MKSSVFAVFLLVVALCAVKFPARADKPQLSPQRPQVEVVFVLDTTGSMSGLIEAAKNKIWAIAGTLGSAQPTPRIKMGLIGYRDRSDDYVTKFIQMSEDLDSVYAELMSFAANGGGDTPESVNQALHEAVSKFQWTSGQDVYRAVFLVGDAPPHMDYQDDVKYSETTRLAKEKGIIINTIQCGSIDGTEPVWREIAKLGAGEYFRVEQSGGAIVASTPFDTELAKLSSELDATRLAYGSQEERRSLLDKFGKAFFISKAASAPALAQRAAVNASTAGEANFYGNKELLKDVADGKVRVDDLSSDELPQELSGLSLSERNNRVAELQEKREEIRSKISDLSKKRQAYIEESVRKKGGGGKSLDHQLFNVLKTQTEAKSLALSDGPAY